MVIKQEIFIKLDTFIDWFLRAAWWNRKAWKVSKYFLIDFSPPSAPRLDFPQFTFKFSYDLYLHIVAMTHIFPRTTFRSFSFIFVTEMSTFWSERKRLKSLWICRTDPLVQHQQIWMLFMAHNKNQLTNDTYNLVTRAQTIRSTTVWLWSTRRMNIKHCFCVAETPAQKPHKNPTADSNCLIKFSWRHLRDKMSR